MNYTGKIIPLAFPDTFVRHSTEKSLKILPYLGIGTKDYVKAGHAALVLIANKTGKAEYYDFGRYITPYGYGRLRSELTDAELQIPIKAEIDRTGDLVNTEELLVWLQQNPDKTHGTGRMLASVCNCIDYESAKKYLNDLQQQGSIPYKAFGLSGSNCSRMVTETLLNSTDHQKIVKGLRKIKKFTPSTLGNVEKAAIDSPIYEIDKGQLRVYEGSVLRENLTNYFYRYRDNNSVTSTFNFPTHWHYLEGIGSGAYFELQKTDQPDQYVMCRYNDYGRLDFKGIFVNLTQFDISNPYSFVYDSNCHYFHIMQKGEKIRFNRVKTLI
ncbi:DUF6695 family protein [Aquimarina brevivitae]|nr:DUF6695 family protein [Aquimarina brevivitae]